MERPDSPDLSSDDPHRPKDQALAQLVAILLDFTYYFLLDMLYSHTHHHILVYK